MPVYLPLQQVDENDQPVGGVTMQEAYDKGLWHRVVLVLVFSQDGHVLLQKRGPNVATNPNKWDFSAGGHVDVGETYYESALRELKEEIGISGVNLQEIKYGPFKMQHNSLTLKRFIKLYKVTVPTATGLSIEAEEVAEAK
jgi:8-oxo-dGTP pyrophosphatase MutT (NUDIX family)